MLIILGQDHSGDSLWFRRNNHEADITPAELAILRMRIVREDRPTVPWRGLYLDESEVSTLIAATSAPQPLWPLEVCRWCEYDATVFIEGDAHCADHARSYGKREAEGMAS